MFLISVKVLVDTRGYVISFAMAGKLEVSRGRYVKGRSRLGQVRPKPETRSPKPERSPKSEARILCHLQHRGATLATFFNGFRASAFFRVSAFGLRISPLKATPTEEPSPPCAGTIYAANPAVQVHSLHHSGSVPEADAALLFIVGWVGATRDAKAWVAFLNQHFSPSSGKPRRTALAPPSRARGWSG